MSTRSMVAYKKRDGSVVGMWKHWDGHPEYMMPLLNDTLHKVSPQEIIRFGRCTSFVSEEEVEKHPDWYPQENLTPIAEDYYISEGKDEPLEFKNLRECFDCNISYLYVWTEGGHRWGIVDGSMLDEL